MLPVGKLRFVFLLEVLRTLALGGVELRKVTLVVVETLTVLMDNICRDCIQECSVVRAGEEDPLSKGCKTGDAKLTPREVYPPMTANSLQAMQWRSNLSKMTILDPPTAADISDSPNMFDGSSNISKSGLTNNALANANLILQPPENALVGFF